MFAYLASLDLSSAITTAGSGADTDYQTNLVAVAGIVIPILVISLVWRKVRGAIR
jgi:hypothetical protein